MNDPVFVIGLGCALMTLVFSTCGLVASAFPAKTGTPLRHNFLLVSILFCLSSPGLAFLVHQQGWGGWIWQTPPPVVSNEPVLAWDVAWARSAPSRERPTIAFLPDSLNQPNEPLPREQPLSWERITFWGFVLWVAGAAMGLAWLMRDLCQLRHLHRLLRQNSQTIGSASIDPSFEILATDRVVMPMVIGILRPVVALPIDASTHWTSKEQEAALLHEAAHIRRLDPLIALFARLNRILFWWCPTVHIVSMRLSTLREQICDDHVLEKQGTGLHLARVMVRLAEICQPSPNQRPGVIPQGLGMWDASFGDLEVRVRNLLNPGRVAMTRMSIHARWILAAFGFLALPLGVALQIGAQEPEKVPQPGKVYPNPFGGIKPPEAAPGTITFLNQRRNVPNHGEDQVFTRMKKIVDACRAYAKAHQGHWPENLDALKPTLADWKETTTHPEHKASYAFHYLPPKTSGDYTKTTEVLVAVFEGKPDPHGATAYADGHLERTSPVIEINAQLLEVKQPLALRNDLGEKELPPSFQNDALNGAKAVVLTKEQFQKIVFRAQREAKANNLIAPKLLVDLNQKATLETATLGEPDPKSDGIGADRHPVKRIKMEVEPKMPGNEIQMAVHLEISNLPAHKDGKEGSKTVELEIKTGLILQSGQTILLKGPEEKGKTSKYLFLTATAHKEIPEPVK